MKRPSPLLLVLAVFATGQFSLFFWSAITRNTGELRVTFLDVGQGDSCVIQSPSGHVLLIDTGPIEQESGYDAGRSIVAPYLEYEGIEHIDAILLTHPHSDHIGGAAYLINRFSTGFVLDNGQDFGSPEEAAYKKAAAQRHVAVYTARPGQKIDFGDGAVLQILAPSREERAGPPNNASIAARLTYGRTSFLFMGDAEAPEETDLLSSRWQLGCTVLKAGHHGSDTSTTPAFLAAAHPRIAVVSVGAHNVYGHPSPLVMQRLRAAVPVVYRTDQNGAVICISNGSTVTSRCMALPAR